MSLPLLQQALTLAFDIISCCGIALVVVCYFDVVAQRSRGYSYTKQVYSIPAVPSPAPVPVQTIVIEPVVHKQGLETMTWRQLVAIARPLKVKRYKSLNKAQLIEAIRQSKNNSSELVAAAC